MINFSLIFFFINIKKFGVDQIKQPAIIIFHKLKLNVKPSIKNPQTNEKILDNKRRGGIVDVSL